MILPSGCCGIVVEEHPADVEQAGEQLDHQIEYPNPQA